MPTINNIMCILFYLYKIIYKPLLHFWRLVVYVDNVYVENVHFLFSYLYVCM